MGLEKPDRSNAAALILLGVGLLQLSGLLLGSQVLRGLGAASGASPLPKVFSDVRGLETFAATFTLEYELSGETHRKTISPEYYAGLRGPYNRRNVYAAALSYGPILPDTISTAVFCYGLAPGGPFHSELGVPDEASNVRVRIDAKTRGREDSWTLQPHCGH